MKNKKQVLIISACLVVMALIIGVLAWLNAPKTPIDNAKVEIYAGQTLIAAYTHSELVALPYVEIEKEILSSSHENESGVYRGVPLRVLLRDKDAALTDGKTRVLAYAQDGYTTSYRMSEVLESDAVMLAYTKDGQVLTPMSQGGTGPYRIIVSTDEFGTRFCKYVYKLEVN